MNGIAKILVALLACLAFSASGQWQWIDKDGRKVYSDRPPPADILEKNILKAPGGSRTRAVAEAAVPAAGPASSARQAVAARPAASGLKVSGKDAELDAKKKAAEAQEASKQKAEEERNKAAQAENCQRARTAKAGLDSGNRIQTTNAKGEREFMSDEAKAAEIRRMDGVLKDCS